MAKAKEEFKIDPDLQIREEFISLHSIQPFIANNSAARGYMFSNHISQSLTLNNSDEKIIQSGLERELSFNTFNRQLECNARIISVIKRYESLDDRGVNQLAEYVIIFQNLETEEYDYISVPTFHALAYPAGFTFRINKELIENLNPGDVVPKDTILADSPGVKENHGYGYGVNVNMCLINIPETSEDGVIISESLAKRATYDQYEKRVVEIGSNYFPLNIYGDKDNFKPFPEIGELVSEDSVLMAIREMDPLFTTSLTSINDVREYDPIFDKVYYVKAPGEIKPDGTRYGEIVDIKIINKHKWELNIPTNMQNHIEKYANSHTKFYRQIYNTYEAIKHEHHSRTDNYDIRVTPGLHQLILETLAILSNNSRSKVAYTYKNEPITGVHIEFTIAYKNNRLYKGNKITGNSGDKGVIVEIRPDDKMPYAIINGEKVVAEVIMDPSSVMSRMNIGRVYEHYFNGASRQTRFLIRQAMNYTPSRPMVDYKDVEIDNGWKLLVDFVKLIDTEQYEAYSKLSSKNDKLEVLWECLQKEVFIYYKISSKKRPYEIVRDIENSIYKPEAAQLHIPISDTEEVITKDPILLAPLYIMVLSKTAETYQSTASAKINHFGLPIVVGNVSKVHLPFRPSPTKILSETETRLFLSYGSRKAIAEVKDRAIAIDTHKHIYNSILNAPVPTNIDNLVDRSKIPYENDPVLDLVNHIMNAAGIELVYTKD